MSWVQIPPEATHFSFFICLRCLSFFLSFHLKLSCIYLGLVLVSLVVLLPRPSPIYLVPVNLFIQVHEMIDLDPASWAALVAQLVRASVRSAECRGFKSHLRQLIFHFSFASGVFLSFFLSFFSSQIIMYI